MLLRVLCASVVRRCCAGGVCSVLVLFVGVVCWCCLLCVVLCVGVVSGCCLCVLFACYVWALCVGVVCECF